MNIPKVVFVANAKTKRADAWILTGKIGGAFNGKRETLCLLSKGRKSCALPERCVFETEEAALAVLKPNK